MFRGRKQMCSIIVLAFGLFVGVSAAGAVDTTTAVTTSPTGSVVVGQAVTVTWTLTTQTSSTVDFCDPLSRRIKSPGSVTWDILEDTDTASGGSPFTSTYPFTPLEAGTYTIEGGYAGCPTSDPVLNASTGSALLTVNKADTTTSVVSDLPSPVTGQTITFTATVAASSPGTGIPTGSVTFYADGTPIPGGQNVALVGGQAQCTASYNASDSTVSITAAYGGDADYGGSDNTASPLVQTIVKADTTTAVTAAPATSVTGEDVTFTATVLTTVPGSGIPTGTVTITVDDNTSTQVATSGVLPLDGSGQATFTTNLMKASGGPYEVTATYSDDSNYNASDNLASPYPQTVKKADTSLSIDADVPDPSIEGLPYDVTWTVIVVTPGSEATGAPTGTVEVEDSESTPNTCSNAVENGATGCAMTSTTAMSQTLTATYAGDADYKGSSNTESHEVSSAATSITVNADINPQLLKGDVTFIATLTPDTAGGPPPTGTVTFKDGGAQIGTDSNGTDGWSTTYAFSMAGAKSITAEYSGDLVYSTSTSSPITQNVSKLDVTLEIATDDPDPSEIGESYDVTWTIVTNDPAPATAPLLTPGGNVEISDGNPLVTCSNAIANGAVGCSIASLTAGGKTLSAQYPGDANFNAASTTAQHQVTPGSVLITITSSNPPTWDSGASGTFTADVTAVAPASGTPSGTVTFLIKDSGGVTIDTSGPHLLSGGSATSDSVTLTSGQSPVSVDVSYGGDGSFAANSGSISQAVEAAAGSLTITSHTPDPSTVIQGFDVTLAYDDGVLATFPEGYVVICLTSPGLPPYMDDEQVSGPGLSWISISVPSATLPPGLWTINARFDAGALEGSGDCANDTGDDEFATPEYHTVYACNTSTEVSFSPSTVFVNQPTTLTATVTPVALPDPPCSAGGLVGKTVSFASKNLPAGADGDFSSEYCILVGGAGSAFCSIVTYTPTASSAVCPATDTHTLVSSFSDGDYAASSAEASLTVMKRPASVSLVCVPDSAYIDEEVTCTVTVSDGTVAPGSTIPTGTVTFDDSAKSGGFAPSDNGSLVHGVFSTAYTPAAGDAGMSTDTTTLDVDYGGSSIYCTANGTAGLEVKVRPTETTVTWENSQGGNEALYVYETGTVTVTVTDIGPADSASPPGGAVTLSGPAYPSSPTITLTPISGSTNASQASYSFRMTSLSALQAFISVAAVYVPVSPQTHDASSGSADVSVQKRSTQTVVQCGDSSPYACTATVTDTAPRGDPQTPVGPVVDQTDGSPFCTLPGLCTKSYDTPTPMMQPVGAGYEPAVDGIHLSSYGMDIITRDIPVYAGDCGGLLHIEDSILGLNITCTIIAALQVVLDSLATGASVIPDAVWTAIFAGTTVPAGDLTAAALTGLSLHGEIAIQTMCTDVDGDGIPGSVEATIDGLWDHFWDSDHDGMGDLDEIDESSGEMSKNYEVSGYASCACPDPTTPDSDGDDILDGAELMGGPHVTSNCNPDTDADDLSDSQEVGTYSTYTSASGAGETIVPRADARDHCNPVVADTDGDGLGDYWEFAPGRLAVSTSDPDYSSYVNDADSDDDGLQDGFEDTNENGRWEGTVGGTGLGSASTGSGETHLCMADTDGDGLSDGEEVALFGSGDIHVVTPYGTVTVPALDTDSDDDGLSDYEEVNTTNTDPLNFDTDGDGLWDVNELKATGGTWPARSFSQVSDPLDPDTDDDDILDSVEYSGTGLGTGHGLGGSDDTDCPYVNDDDSDNDGLQDGVEDANHDGTWGIGGSGITIGLFGTQATKSVAYWETDLCNPDTDGDGIRDGEEVNLIGGGPIPGRPIPTPGFYTVTPEGRSTVMPVGPDYSGGPLFTFVATPGPSIGVTVPALDVDSDNDGLSDYEEVNLTGTDPLDADSDNDTLKDADELIAVGGTVYVAGPPIIGPRRTFDQESDPLDINTDDDHLFDPVEGACGDVVNPGTGLSALALAGQLGGTRDTACPFINDADSDDDGVQDGAVIPIVRQGPGLSYSYIFIEGFEDVATADILPPGTVRTVVTQATGEQSVDTICNVCDPDSDSDGLTDGEEVGLGTNPQDWDTDDDGRGDWHEVTGGGPIPTDPFDPDTDDDGLLDSAEVFGSNTTNPTNADTDGDGLCDGGAGTPYMTSGHATVVVNPICKSCSTPGNTPCGTSVRTGSPDGIGDHPNPMGLGEDENGNGSWDGGETDPNQYDTDGDADGDGIEKLGFSTSRQSTIPSTDMLGNAINVTYPDCGCLDPLDPDTDADGISDGIEDLNHDGNFDFNISDFDFQDLLDGAPQPDPEETNPCDPDTDNDGLIDYDERYQPNPSVFYPYNPTNPLDHDTDNDYLFDGEEVNWICVDPGFNLDPNMDGIDDYFVMTVLGDVLDPTNRDSDSDGFIDGLDPNPCYSWLIPIGKTLDDEWIDNDGDGFADADELAAGTDPNDPDDHPISFIEDFDRDLELDDSLWLEDYNGDGIVDSVAIDLESDGLVDARVGLLQPRDLTVSDFDGDGIEDDVEMIIVYAFANGRYMQPRVVLTVIDLDIDFIVDEVRFGE